MLAVLNKVFQHAARLRFNWIAAHGLRFYLAVSMSKYDFDVALLRKWYASRTLLSFPSKEAWTLIRLLFRNLPRERSCSIRFSKLIKKGLFFDWLVNLLQAHVDLLDVSTISSKRYNTGTFAFPQSLSRQQSLQRRNNNEIKEFAEALSCFQSPRKLATAIKHGIF